jgi:FeS assembly SUF system protein
MEQEFDFLELEAEIVKTLKQVFDPEMPVNIYDLGLIYNIDVNDTREVEIKMTLTAPNCPMADYLLQQIKEKVTAVPGVKKATVRLTFDPPWNKGMMSDEARMELGFL